MEGGGGSVSPGGQDKDRLLEERKNLRRQLRKAETSLWRSKEEDCKKGRKKLGSKLITSKEEYLRALVDKGIRRELRRSERIREYWTRQQEKEKQVAEENKLVKEKGVDLDLSEPKKDIEVKEEPPSCIDENIQKNPVDQADSVVSVTEEPVTICEDLLLIEDGLLVKKNPVFVEGSPLKTNSDLTDLEEVFVAEELLLQENPLVPDILGKEFVGVQVVPQSLDESNYNPVGDSSRTLKPGALEESASSLEAVHLLEPPSSLLLPVQLGESSGAEGSGGGEVVLLQDLGDASGERELAVASEQSSQGGVQVRARRCLKSTQELLYSCITCLVACLGPV